MFTLSSQVHSYNTRSSSAGNFYRKYSTLNHHKNSLIASGLKFGIVSPRIWENFQSMLLRNKYTIYYYSIFKHRVVMLIYRHPYLINEINLNRIILIQCIVTFIFLLIDIFIHYCIIIVFNIFFPWCCKSF